MVVRVVPAGSDDRSRRDTEYRLIPEVGVLAIVTVIAIDAARARANRNIGPPCTIIAYEDAIILIPRLIMVNKRRGTLRNCLAAIIGTMHKRSRCIIVRLHLH